MAIEDIRKKFVIDKTPEKDKVERNNNIVNIELSKLVAFRIFSFVTFFYLF